MTNRILKGAAAALAASLALTACGSKEESKEASASASPASATADAAASTAKPADSKEKITIKYWNAFSGGDGEYMTQMVNKFNEENPNIKVETLTTKFDDYYTRLQTAIVSQDGPDVAIVHSSRMDQFVSNGYLTDLTDAAKDAGVNWGDYNANILASTVYDGKHYSIPLDTHNLVMYYNKKYLKQAGVLGDDGKPVIKPGEEGFKEFLTKIKSAVPKDVAPMAQPNVRIDAYWLWWALYNQMNDGGKFYGEDGKSGALSNPAAIKSLSYVNSLYTGGLIPPNISDASKMFQDDKAAVIITGVWSTGAYEGAGIDLGVVPVPQIYDKPATWGDSHTLAIPKLKKSTPEKLKASVIFANWLASHGDMWAKAGHIPSFTKVIQSEGFKALKYRSDYAQSADFVKYFPRNPNQAPINDEIVKETEKMMFGKQTPEETLKAADAIIAKKLK